MHAVVYIPIVPLLARGSLNQGTFPKSSYAGLVGNKGIHYIAVV